MALALAVRLWGVGDRLPDPSLGINVLDDSAIEETDRTTMGRAWNMWVGGRKDFDLNPHTGGWPALSFYFALALQLVVRGWHWISTGGAGADAHATYVASHSNDVFFFARAVCTLVGVLTVWLTYRLGEHVFGRTAALIGGGLLALNTLHIVTSQHVADPNLLALLFVVLAAGRLVRIAEGGGTLHDSVRAGAWIGLAGACKFVPLVLGVPYLVAHASSAPGPAADRGGAGAGRRGGFMAMLARLARSRAVWLGLLAVLVAMFVATPFLFLDWKRTLHDFTVQRKSLFSDWVGQSQFPISLPTYLVSSLPHAMGWPAYLLGLAGLALLFRSGKRGVVLGLVPVTIILANGMLKAAQERYVLPALPFLFLAAGIAIERGAAWIGARAGGPAEAGIPRAARVALVALLAVSALWTWPELLSLRRALARPDSRHLARRWINEHVDTNVPLVSELYGPVFRDGERQLVIWPFFATQAPLAQVAYHPQFLDGIQIVVLSGEISRRFESEPAKYPVETSYYQWLRENARLIWRSDPKAVSGPGLEIRELPRTISTRAERDSIARLELTQPTGTTRVALWCNDMAKLWLQRGEWDRAEEWARRGFRVGAVLMDPGLWTSLAVASYQMGNPAESEHAATMALKRQPKNSMLHYQRGLALHQLGRVEEALTAYRTSLSLREDPRARVNAARALAALHRPDEAVAELERVPADSPARAAALHDLAMILITELGRPAEAVPYLKESLALDPNQPEAELMRREIRRIEGTAP
jgi:tetratricopeptide (TPR) repeat protein